MRRERWTVSAEEETLIISAEFPVKKPETLEKHIGMWLFNLVKRDILSDDTAGVIAFNYCARQMQTVDSVCDCWKNVEMSIQRKSGFYLVQITVRPEQEETEPTEDTEETEEEEIWIDDEDEESLLDDDFFEDLEIQERARMRFGLPTE